MATRRTVMVLLALWLAACGDDSAAIDGPPGPDDGGGSDGPRPDAAVAACTPVNGTNVVLRRLPFDVVSDMPLLVTSPPNDPRLFVISRDGFIYIAENEVLRPTEFIDLSGPVASGGGNDERGLLGLAFHPQYATNRKFYVFYTSTGSDHVVDEYETMIGDPNVADPSTRRNILEVPDPATNHNGGMIEFGDDGMLYISIGDGGPQNDGLCNAQNTNSLLGKILRIDVDNVQPPLAYGIPSGNPFAGGGGRGEIWMIGMRNPFRWSFDRANGDIYVGDVGQNTYEEVSVVPAAMQSGANLGWPQFEGVDPFSNPNGCAAGPGTPIAPVVDYDPGGSASVIAGQVYRGGCFPDLQGRFFYTDYYTPAGLQSFVYSGGVATDQQDNITPSFPADPTSIHADAFGELYITFGSGQIHRIEAAP
jgi:glucose/arabinose dehydrogenase